MRALLATVLDIIISIEIKTEYILQLNSENVNVDIIYYIILYTIS